ncbi:MAG: helix-turn-helix transcriptional regulator [Eubacteriales bacterium]|nr:helix-turn-helix transcriptional regulator [Eubacteriales bacterium]
MDVGTRIAMLRERRNLTTNRLANLCGLSQSFLRSVELGEKGITVDNLELVCDALHISLHDFFNPGDGNTVENHLHDFLISLTPDQRSLLSSLLTSLD